jgi:hypothetical protein
MREERPLAWTVDPVPPDETARVTGALPATVPGSLEPPRRARIETG